MKYKTLFRLLVKFLGVWFFCSGLISLFGQSTWVVLGYLAPGTFGFPDRMPMITQYLVHVAFQMALGLYLFFRGEWIVSKAIPSNRPYCHECGYDLTGAVGEICNECGTPFRSGGGMS